MIPRNEVKKGDELYMGRPNGQKAKCKIKRVNTKTCTVALLEQYGNGRGGSVGSEWRVPFSMLYRDLDAPIPAARPVQQPLRWNMFTPREDVNIIEAIGQLYCNLSPENLSCDGELPISEVRRREREYTRKLGLLQQALGRSVSEIEYYEWSEQRREWMAEREAKV